MCALEFIFIPSDDSTLEPEKRYLAEPAEGGFHLYETKQKAPYYTKLYIRSCISKEVDPTKLKLRGDSRGEILRPLYNLPIYERMQRIAQFQGLCSESVLKHAHLSNFSRLSEKYPEKLLVRLDQLIEFWENIAGLVDNGDQVRNDVCTARMIGGLWPSHSQMDKDKIVHWIRRRKIFMDVQSDAALVRIEKHLLDSRHRIPSMQILGPEVGVFYNTVTFLRKVISKRSINASFHSGRIQWQGKAVSHGQTLKCFLAAAYCKSMFKDNAEDELEDLLRSILGQEKIAPAECLTSNWTSPTRYRRISRFQSGVWSLLQELKPPELCAALQNFPMDETPLNKLPLHMLLRDFWESFIGNVASLDIDCSSEDLPRVRAQTPPSVWSDNDLTVLPFSPYSPATGNKVFNDSVFGKKVSEDDWGSSSTLVDSDEDPSALDSTLHKPYTLDKNRRFQDMNDFDKNTAKSLASPDFSHPYFHIYEGKPDKAEVLTAQKPGRLPPAVMVRNEQFRPVVFSRAVK